MITQLPPQVSEDWTLDRWLAEAGLKQPKEFAEIAARVLGNAHKLSDNKRVWELLNKDGGLSERDTAIQVMKVLYHAARANQSKLFSREHLIVHTAVFLRSKACRTEFAPLTDSQWVDFLREDPLPDDVTPLTALYRRVHPAPPPRLFGRGEDIQQVLDLISTYPLTMISGVAGEGKTGLAWFVAAQAYQDKLVVDFDWVTDKRYIVNLNDELEPVQSGVSDVTFLERILYSLAIRLGWSDVLGAVNDSLINRAADRLRAGRYLLVLDNLDSVEKDNVIIRQLIDMLSPRFQREPISSRALITSRRTIEAQYQHAAVMTIQGLKEDAVHAFIRYLETSRSIKQPLTDAQCSAVARATGGNPLFIQIAISRYAHTQNEQTFKGIIADLEDAAYNAFKDLFDPLLKLLSAPAQRLCQIAAAELHHAASGTVSHEDLYVAWCDNYEQELPERDFRTMLLELTTNCVLSTVGNGEYTMHPLIRAYFYTR